MNKEVLLKNIDKIHTTEMGINRIKKNLKLDTYSVVDFCKSKVLDTTVLFISKEKTGIAKLIILRQPLTHIAIQL
jgi:hypothetical protein